MLLSVGFVQTREKLLRIKIDKCVKEHHEIVNIHERQDCLNYVCGSVNLTVSQTQNTIDPVVYCDYGYGYTEIYISSTRYQNCTKMLYGRFFWRDCKP